MKIRPILRKIIPFFGNFYFTTGLFLLIWMIFFDANDFISQYRLTNKRKDLEKEKYFYISRIVEVKKEKEEVFGSHDLLEKFAREKYLMKKPTEDIYILKGD